MTITATNQPKLYQLAMDGELDRMVAALESIKSTNAKIFKTAPNNDGGSCP